MTHPALTYDISRLVARVLNNTPNGIDRLDLAYARHFLASPGFSASGIIHLGPLGHRVFPRARAEGAIAAIEAHFGETDGEDARGALDKIYAWLRHPTASKPQLTRPPTGRASYHKVLAFYLAHMKSAGVHPVRSLPRHAIYLCVSQYPLQNPSAFDWLASRPDVRPVFFIHDLLPLEYPEYFKAPEKARHEARMQNLARVGRAALVTTQTMKESLHQAMAQRGRTDLPIHVSPVPLASSFQSPAQTSLPAGLPPYFVMCGTIEPRKNHLLILNVWRELARRLGPDTPKLVLVGTRGWENENVIDMVERSPAIVQHVLEVHGLSTPDLVMLMRGARALLMPSFAEGYGLPVAEARLLGVPVIASDIAVFHEITQGHFTPVHPLNGEAWIEAVLAAASKPNTKRAHLPRTGPDFAGLEAFLSRLP